MIVHIENGDYTAPLCALDRPLRTLYFKLRGYVSTANGDPPSTCRGCLARDPEMRSRFVPQFMHDCPDCIFLGRYTKERPAEYHKSIEALHWQGIDLYFCPKQVGGPTVIARYGHEGPDYSSGMPFATPGGIEELYEAKLRAIKKGLIKP